MFGFLRDPAVGMMGYKSLSTEEMNIFPKNMHFIKWRNLPKVDASLVGERMLRRSGKCTSIFGTQSENYLL